jgi:dihydrodipicolinate synthase/N-acetylneuraminate lyase
MDLIRGIVAAPVLPMTEDFEVDWTGLRDYLRPFLGGRGRSGIIA